MSEQHTGKGAELFIPRGCCRAPRVFNPKDRIFQHQCCKLDEHNWLKGYDSPVEAGQLRMAEVRFKNGRKDFFSYTDDIELKEGEIIAVEASSGHDIGIVTLTGDIVALQMKRKKIVQKPEEHKKVYRHARLADVEKWVSAIEVENETLFKTREIAMELGLDMKLNDVEYQGDKTKAIFYYTAEDRVDFRVLIKRLAEEFRVRVEMKQIGARQEAAKLGGIGSCGRELCCSSWMADFCSVSTHVARAQQLSPNPQKLAGQCGKLKCCLNYEYAAYADALKDFPDDRISLRTKQGEAIHQKTDVFRKLMWYSYTHERMNLMAIPIDKVKEIHESNRKGKMPEKLEDFAFLKEQHADFANNDNDGDLTRFD
jgi:cell fate regulator YaaT (PSP1 superfamily)